MTHRMPSIKREVTVLSNGKRCCRVIQVRSPIEYEQE